MPILVTWTWSLQDWRRESTSANWPLTYTHVPWWTDTYVIWDALLRKTQESHFSFSLPVCSLHLFVSHSTFPSPNAHVALFCSPSFTLSRRAFLLVSTTSSRGQTKLSVSSNSTRKIQQRKKILLFWNFLRNSLKVPEFHKWWRDTL